MITYRSWRQEDLPWLAQAAATAGWEAMPPEEQRKVPPTTVQQSSIAMVYGALASGMGNAIIAEADGRPVGFALGTLAPDMATGDRNGLMLGFWVDPAFRRQGVATGMLRVLESILASAGVFKAKLWTPLQNQAVVNLGQRCGYRCEGVINRKQFI